MKATSIHPIAEALPEIVALRDKLSWLSDGLDVRSLLWISGYAAGLAAAQQQGNVAAVAAEPAAAALSILYGSQTGNAKRAAEKLHDQALQAGIAARLLRLDDYTPKQLAAERSVWLVVSTQGDGDPSDDARRFVDVLRSKRAPRLPQLRYAVLGLGDASYPKFCEIGRIIDERLTELGATRWFARGEADVDIVSVLEPWSRQALEIARDELATPNAVASVTPIRARSNANSWHRDQPFAAEVLANQRITARDSAKDVRHIELSLAESGISYEPGDALGVWPENSAQSVQAVLSASRLQPEAAVTVGEHTRPLGEWLQREREIGKLSRPFLQKLAERSGSAELQHLLAAEQRAGLSSFLSTHRILDVLRAHPTGWDATSLVTALGPLAPRLYSIASSRKQVDDEVHLTVATIAWEAHGSTHHGVASDWLSTRTAEQDKVRVYIEPNTRFRLPANPETDLIMIGPGTGVAPFRAFVQERAAIGATGRHWLFFGNQHFSSQFLYQVEWQEALKRGQLQRLDLAFSRDQAEKIYVQDRLRQQARALYAWLQNGAHVYVCGDATNMAGDVHRALVDVIEHERGGGREDAEAYLAELDSAHRYLRDVY
ncbi:MAG: assimilatory sulfite reductase (NADPH) flavoprotein subunit [Pseudomonadota bacterium]|nr:assimilatory sulfite reductase (NADPH) flavoprotein subunit [Pseudomonadota bacterium]